MSQPMDNQRRKHLLVTAGAALAALLLAIMVTLMDASRSWTPSVSGPVIPDWSDRVAAASAIEITTADGRFTVAREGDHWIMPERDGYAVRPDQIAGLDRLLEGLAYIGARTSDPDKHARIGLAEPGLDGGGVQVTVRDADGRVLSDYLFGEVRGRTLYFRRPDTARSFAASLPEDVDAALLTRAADEWLELDFIALGRSAVARSVIEAEDGSRYVLERPASSIRNFSLRQPSGWEPITAGAGNGPASALSRIRFRDVRRTERLTGAVVGSHTAETFGGLQIRLDIIAQGETRWAVISTSALSDDAQAEADSLQMRTQGWAYLLSDLSLDRLLRPLSEIADPRLEPGDAP